MFEKLTLLGVLGILLPVLSGAQSPPIKPLTIGDTVPDITITNVYNYPASTIKLANLKNKLVILDFMNTYCVSCISVLPKFDSLQHHYADKLQIFIVTSEDDGRVEQFLKTNPVLKNVSIPVVAGDTILKTLFPYYYVSHEAWIHKGVVTAITASEYVTEQNIAQVLSGEAPGWKVKKDIGDYDYMASFMVLNAPAADYSVNANGVFQSALIPYLNGVATRFIRQTDSLNKVIKIKAVNYSIAGLYRRILTDGIRFPVSHIFLDTDDPDFFVYRNKNIYRTVWQEKNTYCYEATFPMTSSEEIIRQKVVLDLDTYLGVKGSLENRKTACFMLKWDTAPVSQKNNARKDYATLSSDATADQLVFISPGNLVDHLNNTFWGIPFFNGIDSTIKTPVRLDKSSFDDIQSLKNGLKKQNMVLQPVTRNVEMLVLTKTSNNSSTKFKIQQNENN